MNIIQHLPVSVTDFVEDKASKFLVKLYNPVYKDLGKVMSDALSAAAYVLPKDIITHEGNQPMGYLVGYYSPKVEALHMKTESTTFDDETRALLWDINMMLYYAQKWQGAFLNPSELRFFEGAIRDEAKKVIIKVRDILDARY